MQGQIINCHQGRLTIQAQGGLYQRVIPLMPQGLFAAPQKEQQALLFSSSGEGHLASQHHFALPVPVVPEDFKQDDTYLFSALGGAQIILKQDGSILLKPAQGQSVMVETATGPKRPILAGDNVAIAGSPPVSGIINVQP